MLRNSAVLAPRRWPYRHHPEPLPRAPIAGVQTSAVVVTPSPCGRDSSGRKEPALTIRSWIHGVVIRWPLAIRTAVISGPQVVPDLSNARQCYRWFVISILQKVVPKILANVQYCYSERHIIYIKQNLMAIEMLSILASPLIHLFTSSLNLTSLLSSLFPLSPLFT